MAAFKILGKIEQRETIASGRAIRELTRLQKFMDLVGGGK